MDCSKSDSLGWGMLGGGRGRLSALSILLGGCWRGGKKYKEEEFFEAARLTHSKSKTQ